MKNNLFVLLSTVFMACGVTQPPASYVDFSSSTTNDPIKKSLFNSPESTISEEDIQRLLEGEIVLPDSARVALYHFETGALNKYYSNYQYNEAYLKLKQAYIESLFRPINGSDRVSKTILMPSILTNQNPSLTNLRESAVRLQADLLVIFSITSDIYYQYKVFKKDQAKAFATIETVLLDIRTGVVPFSNIVTEEHLIQKEKADMDVRDMQRRAENEAVMAALEVSGDALVAFLNEIE